ncbi:MAG: sensor domain-containing diguanylate cyclase [Sporichthyaceae bacterium]
MAASGGILALAFSDPQNLTTFGFGLALAALLAAAALFLPWRHLPLAAQDVPALLFFLVVVVLRDSGGGYVSGVGPMVLIPVCWIAMYGRRIALFISLAAAGAVFVGPWLLIGGDRYPDEELRRGAVLVVVAALVGVAVQTLVQSLKEERAEVIRAASQVSTVAEQLAAVAHVRHSIQVNQDPRAAICEGARDLTGAAMSILVEARSEHELVVTAAVGAELLGATVPLDPGRSAAVDCMLTGQRLFIADARIDSRVPEPLREQANAVALFYEPVFRRGQVVAILTVGWSESVALSKDTRAAMSLMATEASVALEQADLLRTVQQLARTDQLTGIPNRRAFEELLPVVLAGATAGAPLCIALLDLDHFKDYNDAFGHPAGDLFLQDATRAWSRELRGTDVLARFGGEEFVVVLRDCLSKDAAAVLDKLRRATPADQTVSIGIAQWDGRENQQALVRRVDAALYTAKSSGRDRVHCAA